jgi:uncharacterized membrane protein
MPGMETLDDWLVAIHIVCAVIWVGGSFMTQIYAIRTQSHGPQAMAVFSKDAEFIGQRTFLPASLVLLATGIWLVSRDVFTLDDWVVYGLVVIGLSIVTGAGFLGPESGRLGKLIEERGGEDAEVQQRIKRIFLVSRIELVLLFSVVLVMALKPGAG